MSELNWIKHDGGPMPVPGDTPVAVKLTTGYAETAKDAGGKMGVASFWASGAQDYWQIGKIAEYAIVSPTYALGKEVAQIGDALSRQEGGSHYKDMAIQPVEYIMANNLGFCEGAIIKYVSRYKAKNGVEDLRKARHFIDMLIEREEKAQANG